jgi:putative multicomponent Na+:H+ antiporter subunit B
MFLHTVQVGDAAMNDLYLLVIVALLPLVACMLVVQSNPYHALVTRGVLGAVASLVFALLGAADVALTEALVGTMLTITLYAVAVRSSLVLHLGVLKDESSGIEHFLERLKDIFSQWHLRLELTSYSNSQELHQALINKEVHLTCIRSRSTENEKRLYHAQTRISRIYDILRKELSGPEVTVTRVTVSESGKKPS